MIYNYDHILYILCKNSNIENSTKALNEFRKKIYDERNNVPFPKREMFIIKADSLKQIDSIENLLHKQFPNNFKPFDHATLLDSLNKFLKSRGIPLLNDDNSGLGIGIEKAGNLFKKTFNLDLNHNLTFYDILRSIKSETDKNKGLLISNSFEISLFSIDSYNLNHSEFGPIFQVDLIINKNGKSEYTGRINLSFRTSGLDSEDKYLYREKLYNLLMISRNSEEFNNFYLGIQFEVL